jgi:hypothetical protein
VQPRNAADIAAYFLDAGAVYQVLTVMGKDCGHIGNRSIPALLAQGDVRSDTLW